LARVRMGKPGGATTIGAAEVDAAATAAAAELGVATVAGAAVPAWAPCRRLRGKVKLGCSMDVRVARMRRSCSGVKVTP
jgi:hypothetical protein